MPAGIVATSWGINGYASNPEGFVIGAANAVSPCVFPSPTTAVLEARLNGVTPLNPWNAFARASGWGPNEAYFYAIRFLWTFSPPDPHLVTGDTLEARLAWHFSDGSTVYTPWTAPVMFVAGGAGIPGLSGSAAPTALPLLTSLSLSTASPVALANPLSGEGTFDLVGAPIAADGMQWQVASAPPSSGLDLGRLADYETRVLQLVAYYKLADGSYVAGVIADEHTAQGIVLFDHGTPDHIDYWVAPGFTVNLWWFIPA